MKMCWAYAIEGRHMCVRDDPALADDSCSVLDRIDSPEQCKYYRDPPPEECEVVLKFKVHNRDDLIRACKEIPESQRLWADDKLESIPSVDLLREFMLHMDIISGGVAISFLDMGVELQN